MPLSVTGVSKAFVQYRKRAIGKEETSRFVAIENVSFSVDDHEFVSIVGQSGCGKTTLVRILAGIEEATTGNVLLNGVAARSRGHDTAMVFQGIGLFPWLSIEKNVLVASKFANRRGYTVEDRAKARQLLEMVGLGGVANHRPRELSGGMQQRVGLARALMVEPAILLMDEPFSAIDAQTRALLQDELLRLFSRVRQSIIFITHDIDEAVYLSDRILVMSSGPGRIVREVDVALPRPRHDEMRLSPEFGDARSQVLEIVMAGAKA